MTEYRIFLFTDGEISGVHTFVSDGDGDATSIAETHAHPGRKELWQRDRRVTVIPPRLAPQA